MTVLGGPPVGERPVVGAVSSDGSRIVLGEAPAWPEVERCLALVPPALIPVAPVSLPGRRIALAETPVALRRVIGRRRRRRRMTALAIAGAVTTGVVAVLLAGSIGNDIDGDTLAARAEALATSDPGVAAIRAAEAVSARRTDAAVHAALRVTADARLTEAVGQERGRLLAVAIDDRNVITTVSNAGRATRWALRSGRVVAFRAIPITRNPTLRAISRSGRWLLLGTGTIGKALLVDCAGEVGTRLVIVPDDEATALAVSDGRRPAVAFASPTGAVMITRAGRRDVEVDIGRKASALGFSPDATRLAVGTESGHDLVLASRSGEVLRRARASRYRTTVTAVDVDDEGVTLSEGLGALRSTRHVWHDGSARNIEFSRSAGAVLAGRGLMLVPDNEKIGVTYQSRSGKDSEAQVLPSPRDVTTKRRIGSAPRTGRAVVAMPSGRFAVIDLRRIRPVDERVFVGTVVAGPSSLFAVTVGEPMKLNRWDLRAARPAQKIVAQRIQIADMAGDGRRWAVSPDRKTIEIRDLASNRILARVAAPASYTLGDIALDHDGDTVAAVDRSDHRVIVWRLSSSGVSRVVSQTAPVTLSGLRYPQILALAPDGSDVVHGGGRQLLLSETATGRSRPLPTPGLREAIRARFAPDGSRLAIAGDRGAVVLRGARWQSAERYPAGLAFDAVPVEGGVALTTIDGPRLLTGTGPPIALSDSHLSNGQPPSTLASRGAAAVLVPADDDLPLVVLRQPQTDTLRLCQLAGRDAAPRGCAARRRLPAPVPASSSGPLDRMSVLTASGLGPLRLGRQLPAAVKRLPGYRAGTCAVRTLPGLAVAVVTRAGRVETIAMFASTYADEDGFQVDEEIVTDRGMTTSSYGIESYGKPNAARGSISVWRLRRGTGGGRSVLRVVKNGVPSHKPPVTMSVPGATCDVWP